MNTVKTKKAPPTHLGPTPIECPGCQGFGCAHCAFWGYVDRESKAASCYPHKWSKPKRLGQCLNLFTCEKCGETWELDSSD